MSEVEKPINKVIGDYLADKILGKGGFGKTYRVKHLSTNVTNINAHRYQFYCIKR